jgi:hypothetical protein
VGHWPEVKENSALFPVILLPPAWGCQPWQEKLEERKNISHNAPQIFARNVSIRGNLAGKLEKNICREKHPVSIWQKWDPSQYNGIFHFRTMFAPGADHKAAPGSMDGMDRCGRKK